MKIRMLMLVLIGVSAASAFADDKKTETAAKLRIPKYIQVTKAGSIAIYDPKEAPAKPDEVDKSEKGGEVSYVGIDGIVHRAYTQEHLAKIRATYGDAIGEIVQDAHDAGGRQRVKDALNLKRSLEIIGATDEKADAIVRDYLKNATGKLRDAALEDALIDNNLIPPGLKGKGWSLGGLLDLVRDHAILGGSDPAKGITPDFVKGVDDVKHGRRSFDDFFAEFGPGLGAESDAGAKDPNDSPTDPNDNGTDDGAGGDELGGGYQDEDHSGTERGGDEPDPGPGSNPEGNDDPGATDDPDGTDTDAGGGTTYTVDEVNHNDDGTTDVTFHVTGSDGQDGIYTTTYNEDGTYTTTNPLTGEVVGSGTGTPPDVEPGDSTTTTDGDQAIFPTEGDGEEEKKDDEKKDEGETTDTPSTEMEGDPSGEEGAPLPDDIQQMIDAQLAADLKKLKGGDHQVDDENCGGDGKHKGHTATTKISVLEAAAIERAKKLSLVGNPTGIEPHGTGPGHLAPQHDGAIDYGPDHIDDRELGGSGVDPRGTKKIGADHHNDGGTVTSSGSGGSIGGGGTHASNGGSTSSASDDAKPTSKVDPAAKLKARVDLKPKNFEKTPKVLKPKTGSKIPKPSGAPVTAPLHSGSK